MASRYIINETKLPFKDAFYRNLNKQNISGDDYKQTRLECKGDIEY